MTEPAAEFDAPVGAVVSVFVDGRPYRICVSRGAPGHAHVKIVRDPELWAPEFDDRFEDLMAGSPKWLRAI
jgi:hypothetical protein